LTETLLLNLLPHVSDEQLSLAIPRREDRETGTAYVPFPRLEKRGVEIWSQFPFDTSRGIRRWQQAYTDGVSDEPSPKKRRVQSENSLDNEGGFVVSKNTPGIGETSTEILYPPASEVFSSIEGYPTQSPDDTNEESPAMQKMSTWNGAPSLEFQRNFLW
jgi:hypothetical protein